MLAVDLNWLLQFLVFPSAAALFGFIRLVRGAASRFFVVDSTFGSAGADFSPGSMVAADGGATGVSDSCAVCGLVTTKHCSACKMVKYCSEACQSSHWNSEHKTECEGANSLLSIHALGKRKASLVPAGESSKILKQSNKILFPYEQFVQFFYWEELGHPPCGLINCGNSCFANVVLQCLAHTRPLVAYLLEKGHKGKCEMDKWCFFCEFQSHVERANWSHTPFSPINILSRLPCIGSNLTCGEQEDAHEFMRYAINTMQSLCLDEFGGEKAIHPSYQETTLVQHIFGGRLQSQVMCTKCNNVTNQFENIMDLTVEIHGDVVSLEECLDKFTSEEWLHGDNMYKCDRCNDYVMAWKHLSVQQAPNILTITLKRFQGGEFGKLNKKVTFPEMLDLSPYMSELEEGNDLYKLYAVIVHLDLLNASFFGHYICYVRDFRGNWYMIDDSEVIRVGLGHVLSQGAYMLLYSRIRARPSCLLTAEDVELQTVDPSPTQPTEFPSSDQSHSDLVNSGQFPSADCSEVVLLKCEEDLSPINDAEDAIGDLDMVSCPASPPISDNKPHDTDDLSTSPEEDEREINPSSMPEKAQCERNGSIENTKHAAKKSNGESSGDKFKPPFSGATKMSNGEGLGAKLKPIFCRGFLDKPPRKRFTMQDKESSVSVQHSQTSEVSIPHILPNGNHLKDEEKPCRDNGSHGELVVSSSSQENGRS